MLAFSEKIRIQKQAIDIFEELRLLDVVLRQLIERCLRFDFHPVVSM
jgi:hypothetical protein